MDNKNKKVNEETEEIINETPEETEAETAEAENAESGEENSSEGAEEKLQNELNAMKDKLMRHAAEFDNYKKRTQKERSELYATAVCETIEKILPVRDNLERAVGAAKSAENTEENAQTLLSGVEMILKQLDEVLSAIGIEEIKTVGENFDPQKHNAVMHEENEEFGENTVSEEFMKGYMYKDKIVRHSMVKVAN